MNKFEYSQEDSVLCKVLKKNLDQSTSLLNDSELQKTRAVADSSIEESLKLLQSLGKEKEIIQLKNDIKSHSETYTFQNKPKLQSWEDIVKEAEEYSPHIVTFEDILSDKELADSFAEREQIIKTFKEKTGIINKTDLTFLAIAIGLQVTKSLLFPMIASKFNYGESFDKTTRLAHDDNSIKTAQREANNQFRDEKLQNHEKGHWINLLYQTPPYDITRGAKENGIYLGGGYHRLYTLGHDPILGWLFGTMNILTDVMTLNNFNSYRVTRNPMKITGEIVPIWTLFSESYELVKLDYLNLPAAIFAQAQHLKSDINTRLGLPVPLLSSFNENFASKLYKDNYDALCFSRDIKIVGTSFIISKLFDIIIGLVHGFFRTEQENIQQYEVRTRKILLISNMIASSSSIIYASILSNPKALDIGSLLNTVIHLVTDIRFIYKIQQEFITSEISKRMEQEIKEVDKLFYSF